jgi:Domain of unknown function (DUF927)
MRKQFYEKALPTQGVYCATGIKDGKAVNRFAETLDQLDSVIEELIQGGNNTFVALNTFKGYSRKANDAVFSRSFFVDLDVGDSAKKYGSKNEALEALVAFVEFAEMPTPVVVDSGTGVHAYWLLDQDVPSAEWVLYADKFKSYCLEHMKIDSSVTADKARIMRCPETLNYKTDPPTRGRFLTEDFTQHSFTRFKQFLGEVDISTSAVLQAAVKGIDEDTLSVSRHNDIETLFQTIVVRSLEGSGCNQIATVINEAKTLPEPLWHSGLSIARQCSDWEEAIHLMSEDYPRYDRELTIKKANETYDKPHSCEVFETRNPGGCDGCPHRGKITNPLALGRHVRDPDPEENTIRIIEDSENVFSYSQFPEDLRPYRRGPNGGIYIEPKDGEAYAIWEHDVYPLKRMYGDKEGEYLFMRHTPPHDEPRDFMVPMQVAHSPDELRKILLKVGVFFDAKHAKQMVDYITKWAKHMMNKKSAERTRGQMGWTDDLNGFVVGNVEYRRDGTEKSTAASPLIHSISKLLLKGGEYSKWQESANLLDTPGLELTAFGLLCGFGSPLIRFTHINGVSVCFTGDAGSGKSGALYCGLSLFGEPKGLSLAGNKKNSATENALVQWMMGLKNIMMGLDEASNRKPEELSDLLYKVSEAKSKLRMQASVDAVRDIETMSALINLMGSNQSVTSKLASYKNSPDGELARLVEFDYQKPEPFRKTPKLASEIFEGIRLNHGHAGPEYIKALFRIGEDAIQAKVMKWKERFVADFGEDTAYRFYDALVAVTFAGGEIAVEAGIVKLDLERIYKVVLKAIKEIKTGDIKLNESDFESVLGDFQNANQGGTIIINEGKLVEAPRLALVARIEIDTRMYYVSKSVFKTYLRNLQVDEKKFIKYMKDKGVLTYITQTNGDPKFRLSNNWPGHSSTSPIGVYGFKEAIPPELFKNADQPENG